MSNILGQQIGRYQLLDVIGQGGMGIVYRALDPEMNRPVAIKMLHGAYAEDKDLLAMFIREARSTASLEHNNIVTVFSLEESQGLPYLVMQYLEGQSIAEMIASKQSIHLVDKIGLICQVCDGLQYAHHRPEPVIHRDIKPANILVLKDGTAKIIDFGIARVANNKTMTQAGMVRGSLPYMSPEQFGPVPLDTRTDIYSAGVTLFEFLTGEHPFKCADNDVHATIAKILNEPVPPLSKYLSDYPTLLDEIIGKATAKSTEARYQTADDFGYDLSRLQDSLKRGMTADFLTRAKEAIERNDWESARQLLQEVQKSDRRNPEAAELLQSVRQEFQRQQRSVQIGQLRSQAQNAMADEKFEEAFECIEQAIRLDPSDTGLTDFSLSIKSRIDREQKLSEALRQGYAALYAGDLGEAGLAVKAAIEIDEKHTEARALEGLIEKELAERERRIQYQGLLEEARQEISSRNFLSALNYLQKAKVINPADTNISELIDRAAKGHEKEKRRKELEEWTNAIGRLLGEGQSEKALESCRVALQKFPEEASLLKLTQLANHQHDIVIRKHAIDEAGAKARRLVAADKYDEAVTLLVEALRSFPGDPNLETLLAITRAELERRQQEEQERDRYKSVELAQPKLQDTSAVARQTSLDYLRALQQGLDRQLSVVQLRPLAATVAATIKTQEPDAQDAAQYASALTEFQTREVNWQEDSAELEQLAKSAVDLKGAAETDSLLSWASSIAERHPRDEDIRSKYLAIRQFANDLAARRESASRKISNLLRAMQAEHNIGGLSTLEKQMLEIAEPWLRDDSVRGLVSQATAQLEEARQRHESFLLEVRQLANSIRTARSAGQVRLLVEQARLLTTDFDEADVRPALTELQNVAKDKLEQLERTVVELRKLAADVTAAKIMKEAETCAAAAERLVSGDSASEEADDLLRRIQHGLAERRKEYRRIAANLEKLADSSAMASGPAELDLILARRRDLAKKFPDETCFRNLEARLEASVAGRRVYLAEQAALASADETEEIEEAFEPEVAAARAPVPQTGGITLAGQPGKDAAEAAPRSRHRLLNVLIPSGALLGIAAVSAFFMTGTSVTIATDPSNARLSVDGRRCSANPCTLRLRRGQHELTATQSGFQNLDQTFTVSSSDGDLPLITMTPSPRSSVTSQPRADSAGTQPGKLSVETGVPHVSVFVDGRLEGHTSIRGQLTVSTVDGPHELRVEKQGYKSVAPKIINVSPNATVPVPFTLENADSSPMKPTEPVIVPKSASAATGNPSSNPGTVMSPPPAPLPVSAKLTANSDKISEGQPVTLIWQTENANDVTIEGVGAVAASGSRQINLDQSTTFRLIAKGPAGTANASVDIDVIPANKVAPTVLIDADREGIKSALRLYKEAYETESMDDMKKVWEGISKRQQEDLKETFSYNAIRLELTCPDDDIHIAGNEASANCRQVFSFTLYGKKQPPQVNSSLIGLRKKAGAWKIVSVSGR